MHRTVVLPSPLLPARAYAPLAHALGRRGWGAVVAAVPEAPDGPDLVLAAYRDAVTSHRADLVVAHSNAGRYAVAAAGGAPVVYVDAALPPEHGDATLAPEGLLDHLAGLADDDGLLPPWTRWWGDDEVGAVRGHGLAERGRDGLRPRRGPRHGSDGDAPPAAPEGVDERGVGASRQQRAREEDGAAHRPIMLTGCRGGPARARWTRRAP